MAINPADLGLDLQPGDKISMTFHKAKAEPGGSFVQNAQSAGMVPGGPQPPTGGMSGGMNAPMMPMASPSMDNGTLVARMRQRLGLA